MQPRGYAIIASAFFTVSIAYAIRYGYGILLPGMLETLQMSKTGAGLISAAYFLAYTLFSPLLGILSDRLDSRVLLTIFPALLSLGGLLMAWAGSVTSGAICFGLAGLGHAACWSPVVSLVQQWVPDRYRGTALSVATMGSGIGIAAWSLWLPRVAEGALYRVGWIQMGLFGFCVAGLNWLLVRDPESKRQQRVSQASTQGSTGGLKNLLPAGLNRALLTDSRLWLVGLSYSCIGFVVMVPFTFLNVYATQELHLDYATASFFFTVIAVSGLVGKLILGVLSDFLGRVMVMILCGLLLGFGCWGIAYCGGLHASAGLYMTGLYLSVALVGLGFGAVWPMYAAAAVDYFPKSLAGSIIGLWTVFLGVGSILSPVLCGWSIDRLGSHVWAFNLGLAAGLGAALLLVPLLYPTIRKISAEEAACCAGGDR